MSKLKLEQRVIGMVSTNVYLAINKETSECFLVDPADRADAIDAWIQQNKCTLKGILLTHGHFDHIGAVGELRKKYQVPVYCHESEKAVLEDSVLNLSTNWTGAFTAKCDILLKDEEEFELAGFKIIAYHTPGHTKGGACYYLPEEEVLFSGDTIFCRSIGRTDFPTGNMRELVTSLKRMVELLPENTVVFPGHESSTTIGDEKRYNPYI
ncbi:MAG: MBL fold metallo-hydrolase [Muricoprocola sp.]